MKRTLAVLAVALLAAGCTSSTPVATTVSSKTSSDPTASTPTQAPTPTEDPAAKWKNAVEFTTLVHTDKLDKARHLVAQGSHADRYLTHQTNMRKADRTNGTSSGEGTNPTIEAEEDKQTVDVTMGDVSYTWSKFQYDADGKITSWTGAKGPIENVLAKTQPSGKANGLTVKVLSAYLSNAGNLAVVLDLSASRNIESLDYSPSYTGKDGLAYKPAAQSTPDGLSKGERGLAVYWFDDSDFGGKFTFGVYDANYNEAKIRLTIK